MRNQKMIGLVCGSVLLGIGGSALGQVIDIRAEMHGDDWFLLEQSYISRFSTSPAPHFGLDTLNLTEETVTDAV